MERWIKFDDVKKAVPLPMVLAHYGFDLRPAGPHVLRGKCRLPMHGSDTSKESFIATLDKGLGGAWSCHSKSCVAARGGKVGGNSLDLVALIEGCSIRDAALKMQSWVAVPVAAQPEARGRQEPPPARPAGQEPKAELVSGKTEGESDGPNKPLAFALKSIDLAHPYAASRGITPETAAAFGIGLFTGKGMMAGRYVIPIHDQQGQLVAYAGRATDGTEPKYKFPAGFRKSLELFNLHRVPKAGESVVLVEGFFDCMHVSQAGFPCVALMGCAMSQTQERLLSQNFGEVILMLDGDAAGRAATEETGDRLQQVVYSVNTVELTAGIQPDQLSAEEIENILRPIF
jgi:DNA primase